MSINSVTSFRRTREFSVFSSMALGSASCAGTAYALPAADAASGVKPLIVAQNTDSARSSA